MGHGKISRRWLWVVSIVLLAQVARAQAVLRKDLKQDFGALGDGRTNDQGAFERAAAFFNQRARTPAGAGRAVLRIPRGVYRVGQPSPGSLGNLLHLTGCRNLAIVGEDSATTEIRYADSLRYGTFDPTTHLPYDPPTSLFTDWNWGVRGGTAIVLQNCENVAVTGLNLNGNSPHLVVGGHWGDTGIQLAFDGIFVSDSRRIRLRRLAVHHFGRDGVQVLNRLAKQLDDPAREDILLEDSRFDYNGRQGLSLTGVNGLRAVRCSFSHTGRVVLPALGRPLYSNPGAGIDIEPEGGYVAAVRLEGCRLVDNAGQALVSDRYGTGPPTTRHIVLHECLLWGVTNWSAWVRQTDFLFTNCRLYGAFVTGCALAAYATRFVGCTFEDRPYHGQPAYGQALVYSNREARAMCFTNCRFVATRGYLLAATPAAPDTASRFRLRGCTFVLDYAEPPQGSTATLLGAVLSGKTTLASPARRGPISQVFVLGSAGVPGSAALASGSWLLLAPGVRYLLPAGLAIGQAPGQGRARVLVGAANTLVVGSPADPAGTEAPELYVGARAQLVVKKGGALELGPHTKMTIAGQVVVESGAYFFQDPQAEVRAIGRGRLHLAAGASQGQRPPQPASN